MINLADLHNETEFPASGPNPPTVGQIRHNGLAAKMTDGFEIHELRLILIKHPLGDVHTFLIDMAERYISNEEAFAVLGVARSMFIRQSDFPIQILNEQCDKGGPHRPGFIYLLESEEASHFKIGRTVNLTNRITTFGIQLPFKTKLRHSFEVKDMACAESALHETFMNKRLGGEWFALDTSDVDWFCTL